MPRSSPSADQGLIQREGTRYVLVVDDVLAQRKVISRVLRKVGYEVICVSSALAATTFLWECGQARLLITDQRMRGLDGLELLSYCAHEFPGMPRILYTAYFDGEVAMATHLHHVIDKLHPERLLPKVRELIGDP